ncbi:MAG: hypothetical protein ABFQ95_03580 [Pseudomonadota bacterium]
MHLLNRISLVGKLKKNLHTLLIVPGKSIWNNPDIHASLCCLVLE